MRGRSVPMPTNRILASLTPKDHALLRPHLEIVHLTYCSHLQVRNQRIQHIYFKETGVASVFWGADEPIEIAMIGYEGMSGVAAVLGNSVRGPYETYVQIAGRGQRLAVRELRAAMNAIASLTALLHLRATDFLNQIAQAVPAHGIGTIEERLGRWLLMAADRMTDGSLPITHVTLLPVLGGGRSGVSCAL